MKARITVVFEYTINPEFYPAGLSPQEMAELDAQNYGHELCGLHDALGAYPYTVSGTVVEGL